MSAISDRILKKVRGYGRGKRVFTWKDFSDLGKRSAIDQALSRLTKAGKLRRVARGMYDLPRFNRLLKSDAPVDPTAVVAAVSRRDGVIIRPDDAAAANAFGLTTAVPVQQRFRTNGSAHRIRMGDSQLDLRPAGRKVAPVIGTAAAGMVQAMRYAGRDAFGDPHAVAALKARATQGAKKALVDKAHLLPAWMNDVAQQIAGTAH